MHDERPTLDPVGGGWPVRRNNTCEGAGIGGEGLVQRQPVLGGEAGAGLAVSPVELAPGDCSCRWYNTMHRRHRVMTVCWQ